MLNKLKAILMMFYPPVPKRIFDAFINVLEHGLKLLFTYIPVYILVSTDTLKTKIVYVVLMLLAMAICYIMMHFVIQYEPFFTQTTQQESNDE